jgi:hypothetical protein
MSSFKTKLSEEAKKLRPQWHEEYQFVQGAQWAVDEVIRMLKNPLTHGELCQWLNDGFVNPSPERVANWLEQQVKGGSDE